jgi:hypothetical protein
MLKSFNLLMLGHLQAILALGVIAPLPLMSPAAGMELLPQPSNAADSLTIAGSRSDAAIVLDERDYPVVRLAANLFADDVRRVTGHGLLVTNSPGGSRQLIVVGTLGGSALIQQLAAGGKLKGLDQIQGRWEATLMQMVAAPFPGVDCALVIVGSDRRGAAYGLMELSKTIGVSPWYWWADVPAQHHDALAVRIAAPQMDAPGVKYRGFFINDEDWGMNPWAARTFDADFKNIGPKTYGKVFELMLRLRLNYLWPAMHGVTTEFGSTPENYELADRFGIVMGASHCEPMLYNNVHWNERTQGRWNYSLNQSNIFSIWRKTAKDRGQYEAVWTIGIRGIHDAGMETPPNDMPGKINLMGQVFHDQRELLKEEVTTNWGPVAQCFVPYKEVLPIYDAGLKVPDDVTLVWVDDNFGYIRRLSNPDERKRPGGAGVYWHMSYYGGPHSYTWINTTAPALVWEELHKAWENGTRNLWVINVGDLKPMEIGIDYFSRLAWNPDGFPVGGQRRFLRDFAAENFGETLAGPVSDLLMDFYRLGTIRKPELMERNWAVSLAPAYAGQLEADYRGLLDREKSLAGAVPAEARDAYTELVGFPAQVVGDAGLIFMADRKIQATNDVAASEQQIAQLRSSLEAQVGNYNTNLAGGKWNRMMPGLVTGRNLTTWNSQVRWPWGEPTNRPALRPAPAPNVNWRDAATADRRTENSSAHWSTIEGLGPSGEAVALLPADLTAAQKEEDAHAPTLEFDFNGNGGDAEALVDFLPTFRLVPGMKQRVAVSVDNGTPMIVEVPGSSGAENENGQVRSQAVQDNFVRARVPLSALPAGKHTFKIRAIDPGAVVDQVLLP